MGKGYVDFSLSLYTEIIFGTHWREVLTEKVRKYGGTKVLVVYGKGSAQKSGLLNSVCEMLADADIAYASFGGAAPNPKRSHAQVGLEYAKEQKVDFVLGIGGASTIDTAKAIAMGMLYDGDLWDFFCGKAIPENMLPVGTIHTIAAAGSEMSGSAVLVDDLGDNAKKGLMYPNVLRPVFAIMDPTLTYTVSAYQTAAGAIDSLAHTLDRFFSVNACALSDEFAFGVMQTIVRYASVAIQTPEDYEARAELMLASAFAHNDITGLGGKKPAAGVHNLEANISGNFSTTHGAGIGIVMPPWLRDVIDRGGEAGVEKAAQLAIRVFDIPHTLGDQRDIALEGVRRLREWISSLGMPLTLGELGIAESHLDHIVEHCRCSEDKVMHGFIDYDKAQIREFFSSLL